MASARIQSKNPEGIQSITLNTLTTLSTVNRNYSARLIDANDRSTVIFPGDSIETIETLANETITTEQTNDVMGRNTLQAVTKIDIGSQSQLLAAPGQTVSIYYEVTNLREEPTFHIFQVLDEQRYLRSLNPQS